MEDGEFNRLENVAETHGDESVGSALADALIDLDASLVELSSVFEHPAFGRASDAMNRVIAAVMTMMARPQTLDVTLEHHGDAVALVTAFLEHDLGHRLLASTLKDVDDRSIADPLYRIGVTAALAQLCSDALLVAVLSDQNPEDEERSVWAARCRELLGRITMTRQRFGT